MNAIIKAVILPQELTSRYPLLNFLHDQYDILVLLRQQFVAC